VLARFAHAAAAPRAEAPPGVRALLNERLAWAYAVAGHDTDTERALEAAQAALQEADGTPQPDGVAWVDSNELQIMTGRCWTELRRPLRAVPVLTQALDRYDDTHARQEPVPVMAGRGVPAHRGSRGGGQGQRARTRPVR
jgi:hypothetical protein